MQECLHLLYFISRLHLCDTTVCFVCFFFFQAEDGIRDHCVTGVQTCALPILKRPSPEPASIRRGSARGLRSPPRARSGAGTTTSRSEERRVGKECRSRWWAYQ